MKYLIISFLPFGLEIAAMWIAGKFPVPFIDLMLWPSVAAIGFIWCTMSCIDILFLKGHRLLESEFKKEIDVSILLEETKRLIRFKTSVLAFFGLALVEGIFYVALLMKNYKDLEFNKIAAIACFIIIGLITLLSLVAQCFMVGFESPLDERKEK